LNQNRFCRHNLYEEQNKNEALEPIKRLMLAVLTDAVRCYQIGCAAPTTSRRRTFQEAEEWLLRSRPKADSPFSFESVYCALEIAPDYLRHMLHRWQAQRVRGVRVALVRRSSVMTSVKQPTAASLAALLLKDDSPRCAGLR